METSIVGFVGSSTTARETDACICGHGVTAHNIKRSTGDMLAVCVILLPFILLQSIVLLQSVVSVVVTLNNANRSQ